MQKKKKKRKKKKRKKKKKVTVILHQLLVYLLLCFLLLLLLAIFLHLTKTFCRKRLFHRSLCFRRMGEYISLDLFYILQCTVITARFSIQSYPYILTRHKHRLQHSPYVMYRYATPTLHRSVTSDKGNPCARRNDDISTYNYVTGDKGKIISVLFRVVTKRQKPFWFPIAHRIVTYQNFTTGPPI